MRRSTEWWNTGPMGVVILECVDGHFFTANRLKLVFFSVHLIDRGWLRCPVDHKWRVVGQVGVNALTEAQLDEAKRYRF